MSITTEPTAPHAAPNPNEIAIISHSTLFYWWPVWAVGFLLGILTYFGGARVATVPAGTVGVHASNITVPAKGESYQDRDVLVLPQGKALPRENPQDPNSGPRSPYLHIAGNRAYGVIWATVLLLVTVITNVPLRGMWSVVVIFLVVLLSLLFALFGWWEFVLTKLSLLDIRINTGGYFFISGILLIAWLITTFVFDQQLYMVFTPGQLKVCTEIGGGERVYDAVGLSLEKQRSDLFRHWILGLGSGDLVVKTSGAQSHHFDLPNVLFIGRKVKQIEDMLKKRAVIETR